jgi:Ala-tRNA(Pro) deacylase
MDTNNTWSEERVIGPDRRARVYALLDSLGVTYETVDHPALFSAADNIPHEININAVIFKNLFLRNKNKSRYYLYSLPIHKKADLLALQHLMGESRLSFGHEDALWEKLHIIPGSVSILNVVDAPGTDVTLLIDKEIYDAPRFGVHPNDNTATVILTPEALIRILDAIGVTYRFIEL